MKTEGSLRFMLWASWISIFLMEIDPVVPLVVFTTKDGCIAEGKVSGSQIDLSGSHCRLLILQLGPDSYGHGLCLSKSRTTRVAEEVKCYILNNVHLHDNSLKTHFRPFHSVCKLECPPQYPPCGIIHDPWCRRALKGIGFLPAPFWLMIKLPQIHESPSISRYTWKVFVPPPQTLVVPCQEPGLHQSQGYVMTLCAFLTTEGMLFPL